jgi:hypothetical protein
MQNTTTGWGFLLHLLYNFFRMKLLCRGIVMSAAMSFSVISARELVLTQNSIGRRSLQR